MRLQHSAAAYYLPQKTDLFFALLYKNRADANTLQVLPVQAGLYRYDE